MSKKQKYQGSNPKQGAAPNPVPVSGLLGKLFATKEQALPSAGITPPIWQESEVTALINQLPVEARTQFAALIEQFAQMGSQLKAAISQNEESQRSAQTTKNDYEAQLAQLEPRKTELQRQQLALESQTAVLNDREQALATREVASTTRERELIEREIAIRSGLFEEQQRALTTLREQVAVLEAQRVQLPLTIEEDRQRLLAQTKVLINELLEQVKKRDEEIGQREVALVTRSIGLDRREDRLRVGGSQLVNAQEATKQAIREEFEIELQEQRQRAQRLERQNVRLSDKLDSQQAELDEFQDIRDQLGNNPERLLEQLEKLKKDNRTLDLRVQDLQASRSEEDVTLMRSQRDSLQERLSAAEEALFDLRRRESEWRMGVTEREDWQRQRVVLQKHRDLLAEAVQRLQSDVEGLVNKQQGLTPFPELTRMDLEMTTPCVTQRPPNLKDLVVDLQTRIAFAEPGKELHFRTEDLQLFVGGLAMSQLHIFQGISGTGKTSLATAFAKAVGGVCTTISVQAGWRDRADLLGHYNTFEKRYYEGEALQALYRAQTDADRERIHVVLLDEMNLSRPEQYFANFLSTLELGEAERWISLMESRPAHGAPVKLRDGRFIQVPPNLWFIGTANHDETPVRLPTRPTIGRSSWICPSTNHQGLSRNAPVIT